MKRIVWTLALAASALAVDLPGPMAPAQAAACECRTGSHNTCPQGYHCKTGGCASGGAPSSLTLQADALEAKIVLRTAARAPACKEGGAPSAAGQVKPCIQLSVATNPEPDGSGASS
jgi:hypothetical protein